MNINFLIKKTFGYFVVTFFIMLSIVSFAFYKENRIPLYQNILEAIFFIYAIGLSIVYINDKQISGLFIFFVNLIYILVSFIYAVILNKANALDFFMIYKTFVYIMFLTLIIGKATLNGDLVLKFIKFIFYIFLFKYLISLILSLNDRPIVFTENNFELMLLCTLYLVFYQLQKKQSIKYLFLLGLIILLSFSRSALFMYSIIFFFIMNREIKKYKILILSFSLFVLILMIVLVFTSRTTDFENIDRLKFFFIFLYEVRNWDFFQFLIGAPRITHLSTESCSSLSFYASLFSYSGDGSCYSAILHSYLLRIIFDHGFVGLFIVIYFVFKILKLSGLSKEIIRVVIVVFIVNGLSVSSFNSIFFPLSIIFLIGTDYKKYNSISTSTN